MGDKILNICLFGEFLACFLALLSLFFVRRSSLVVVSFDGTFVMSVFTLIIVHWVVVGHMEVSLRLVVLLFFSRLVQIGVVDVGVFNSVSRRVLNIVPKVIVRVLDDALKNITIMILNIAHIGVSVVVSFGGPVLQKMINISDAIMKAELEVTSIGVLGNVTVRVMVHIVSHGVMLPVVGEVLNTVTVVVLVHMLGVVITLILLRVVVAHVVCALRFDVMVLTMLLASKVTLITKVRLMVLQIPVALAEMSVGVLLDTVVQDMSLVTLLGVVVLVRSLLTQKEIISDIVLFGLGLGRLGSSGSSLLLVVHLLLSSHVMVEMKTTMNVLLILTVGVVVLSILFMIVSLKSVCVSMIWVHGVGSVISIAWELFV